MKKLFLFSVFFALLSCHKDSNSTNNQNPYLPNYSFSMEVNLTLPNFSDLHFASKGVRVYPPNGPSKGVIIFNTGSGYTAYDGGCPNQSLSSCSTLTINGINAICPCDSASYSLFTGICQGKEYPLKGYRVEVINADLVRVYN